MPRVLGFSICNNDLESLCPYHDEQMKTLMTRLRYTYWIASVSNGSNHGETFLVRLLARRLGRTDSEKADYIVSQKWRLWILESAEMLSQKAQVLR